MKNTELDSMMYVIGFNDHPDGNAYKAEEHLVELPYVFITAIDVLSRCDNVCITDTDHHVENLTVDFLACAPFSINMSVGQYAKPTKSYNCKQSVNNS